MARVLIIDDEEKLRSLTARIISIEGFEVAEAGNCKVALQKINQQFFDVVLCDVKLPDGNGVDLTLQIRELSPDTEIIVLTAYGNIKDGVQAIKNGAFNYIVKGDDNNRIIPLLHSALEKSNLTRKVAHLESRLNNKFSFEGILGGSDAIKEAIQLAEKVAPTGTTVLLTGETGTGKEIFANAIHQYSPRKNGNFVAINCSAISHELLESEMFGHLAGAFTGATKDKKGLLEEADGGTLFLDEIGEMPADLQAKLLRVLELGEFIKVGSNKTIKTDVRIIAATNRDLLREIASGHFRQDLYYRLSIFRIQLPSLRERVADIEELSNYFIQFYADKTNKKIKPLTKEVAQMLRFYGWPGNIRELKNVIERSIILENTDTITVDTLPAEIRQQASTQDNAGGVKTLSAFSMASAEKIHIQKVLNYTKGNKSETARLLNIGIATLYRKLDEYKIQ